jgi:hypothetical protein
LESCDDHLEIVVLLLHLFHVFSEPPNVIVAEYFFEILSLILDPVSVCKVFWWGSLFFLFVDYFLCRLINCEFLLIDTIA